MKFKTGLLFLMFVLGVNGCALATESEQVKITAEYAKFYFPIYEDDQYTWYRDSTANSQLEYAFEIHAGALRTGFSLFKFPGAKPMSGSLSALLSRGQKSTWIQDGINVTTSTPDSVDVFYERPNLVISITNPATLEFLDSTEEVRFFVRGFESYYSDFVVSLP